jgi:hypothetical protein
MTDREKNSAEVHKLAEDLAVYLGNGWTHVRPKPDSEGGSYAHLTGPTGEERLHLYLDNWKNRVRISGGFPQDYDPYGKKFEITVAESRPAREVAKEVQRRIFPEYLPAIAEALARKAADLQRCADARALAAELAAVIGAQVDKSEAAVRRHSDHSFRFDGAGPLEDISLEGKIWEGEEFSIDLKFRCNAALAAELLQAVRRFGRLQTPGRAAGPLSARTLWEA